MCRSLSAYKLNSFPRCDSRTHILIPPSGFQNSGFNQVSQISHSPQISLSSKIPHDEAKGFLWCYGWTIRSPEKSPPLLEDSIFHQTSVGQFIDLGTVLDISSVPPQLAAHLPAILTSAWIFLCHFPWIGEARCCLACVPPSSCVLSS